MLNVNRSVQDTFYRYKMPPMQTKVEGRGNGIKTVLLNLSDVSRALKRRPDYLLKFFGNELGAQTKQGEHFVVNGVHDAEKLQTLLDTFINKFVLCAHCENPETTLKVVKGLISRNCLACGRQSAVDMRHKLAAYVLKNFVEEETQYDKIKKKNDARAEGQVEVEDEEWGEDTSAEAVEKRRKDLSNDFIDSMTSDPYESLAELMTEKTPTHATLMEKANEVGLKVSDIALVYVQMYFGAKVVEDVKKHAPFLIKLIRLSKADADKVQNCIIGALERVLDREGAEKQIILVLKELYDQDIIEEEIFLEWGKKCNKRWLTKEKDRALKRMAKPFLTWLEEADEESEEE